MKEFNFSVKVKKENVTAEFNFSIESESFSDAFSSAESILKRCYNVDLDDVTYISVNETPDNAMLFKGYNPGVLPL